MTAERRGGAFSTTEIPPGRHSAVPRTSAMHFEKCRISKRTALAGGVQRFSDLSNSVVLNLYHCWDPLNATDVVWNPQVKIEKVCAPE